MGLIMRKALFFQALYSWDEFWQTIEMTWATYGDPRHFTEDRFTKWASERIQVPHGSWFAWPMPVAPLAHMSEQDVNRLYRGQLPRYWVIYDHAYRVMDWLGFKDNASFAWWLFAYVAGDLRKLLLFIRHRVPGIIDDLLGQLAPMATLVAEISKDKLPHIHPRACPPSEYGLLNPSRKPKYPFFDPALLSPKYRQDLMPEPLDKLTIKQRRTIAKALGVKYDPAKELAEERATIETEIKETPEHPIYKLIHMTENAKRTIVWLVFATGLDLPHKGYHLYS